MIFRDAREACFAIWLVIARAAKLARMAAARRRTGRSPDASSERGASVINPAWLSSDALLNAHLPLFSYSHPVSLLFYGVGCICS